MPSDRLPSPWRLTLSLALASLLVPSVAAQEARYRIKSEIGVRVPMRDGVHLATDVLRPDAEGRFPVVIQRTPYGRREGQPFARELAGLGFACVWQDTRGRFESEGEWHPLHHEAEDGHDTIEWAADQPWSTGQVATFGGSYAAAVQWMAAKGRSPHLVGMIPFVGPGDGYDLIWGDGALNQGSLQNWATLMEARAFGSSELAELNRLPWDEVHAHFPVLEGLYVIDREPDFYLRWIEHPTPDDYWEPTRWRHDPPDVPVLHLTGWYDIFQDDTIDNFMLMRAEAQEPARSRQRLVVGPWVHQGTGRRTGEVDFGPEAELDFIGAEVIPFLDQRLRGAEPDGRAPVHVFTMGENRWHDYDDWPVPGTRWTDFFLSSLEGANSRAGDGRLDRSPPEAEDSSDRYDYDPREPVPTHGGGNCCWPDLQPWGPMDQRGIEQREDVLVYTTPPLEEDLRVTGPVELVLFVTSSAPDTDFTAKLVDVDPEGLALNLTEGILRTRYRESRTEPRLLVPGELTELRIDLGHTSHLFRKGHGVRLEVSSSDFPRYSRNTNTGAVPEQDPDPVVAHQRVFHDLARPSRLVLPVLE